MVTTLIVEAIDEFYIIGFVISWFVIAGKCYRAMRDSAGFNKGTVAKKTFSVLTAFFMVTLLSMVWIIVVLIYIGQELFGEHK